MAIRRACAEQKSGASCQHPLQKLPSQHLWLLSRRLQFLHCAMHLPAHLSGFTEVPTAGACWVAGAGLGIAGCTDKAQFAHGQPYQWAGAGVAEMVFANNT